MRIIIAQILAGIGVFFWFYGSLRLVRKISYFNKIHALGISDTVGTALILTGGLVYSSEGWSHMLLALGAVIFWGTALGVILARLGISQEKEK